VTTVVANLPIRGGGLASILGGLVGTPAPAPTTTTSATPVSTNVEQFLRPITPGTPTAPTPTQPAATPQPQAPTQPTGTPATSSTSRVDALNAPAPSLSGGAFNTGGLSRIPQPGAQPAGGGTSTASLSSLLGSGGGGGGAAASTSNTANPSGTLQVPDLTIPTNLPQGADPSQLTTDLAPIEVGQLQAQPLDPLQQGAISSDLRDLLSGSITDLLSGGLDRSDLVRQQFENLQPVLDERFGAAREQAGQQAAAFGRGGAGQTATAFADLTRQRGSDEQRLLNDLLLQAAEAEFADRFRALGAGTQLEQLGSSEILQRQGLQSARDIAGAELGLTAGRANQQAALQAGLQAQGLGVEQEQFGAGLQESAAQRALQAGLQGQQLGTQIGLGELQSQTQIRSAQIQAAASQAAAQASVEAARIGASSAQQRQAAQLAFQREVQRQEGLFDFARLSEQARQFDVNTGFRNQDFQLQLQRQAAADQLARAGLLQQGFVGQPTIGGSDALLQQALGSGVSNFGAQAAASNQQAGSLFGAAGQLLGPLLSPGSFGGISPTTFTFPT